MPMDAAAAVGGEVAERSKALRQGRNLFGGVGSNPTLVTPFGCPSWSRYRHLGGTGGTAFTLLPIAVEPG